MRMLWFQVAGQWPVNGQAEELNKTMRHYCTGCRMTHNTNIDYYLCLYSAVADVSCKYICPENPLIAG